MLPKMTKIEQELGMDENTLRHTLFGRTGISERVIFKLQSLLDIEVVTREEIESTQKLWIDHLYGTPTKVKGASRTRKTSKKAEA